MRLYKGYPESMFWWAIEKKKNFQTIYIAICCTQRILLFDIVYTIVEAPVVAEHQFLCSCIIEWCRLQCKPCVNGFLTLLLWNRWTPVKDFRCWNTWKSLGAKSGLRGEMIELFPAKCHVETLCCGYSVWACIVMKHHNTLTKHATLLVLHRMMQFLKCVTIDTS
jgi:hypothetical protein